MLVAQLRRWSDFCVPFGPQVVSTASSSFSSGRESLNQYKLAAEEATRL